MMVAWEYQEITKPSTDPRTMLQWLNALGQEGWEVVPYPYSISSSVPLQPTGYFSGTFVYGSSTTQSLPAAPAYKHLFKRQVTATQVEQATAELPACTKCGNRLPLSRVAAGDTLCYICEKDIDF